MGSSKNLYQSRYLKWWVIQPLVPNKPRDLPRVEDRRVLSGIFLGSAPGSTACTGSGSSPSTNDTNRFMAWRKAGVFDRFMRAITEAYKYSIQMIDSTKVPVHQHAANDHAGL